MLTGTLNEIRDGAEGPKMIHLILLMAARDEAVSIRFQCTEECVRMWYLAPNENREYQWFEMIPAPTHYWPLMVTVIREASSLYSLNYTWPRGDFEFIRKPSWYSRFIGRKQAFTLEGGILHHYLGKYESKWGLTVEDDPVHGNITFSLISTTSDRSIAQDMMQLLADESGMVHFDEA